MSAGQLVKLCVLILLLMLSAFFSSAETAYTTLRRVRMQMLADEGNRRAAIVLKTLDKPGKMLTAILIGNNVVNITASAMATILAQEILGNMFVSLSTGILTILVLLFGEITPKTLAMRKNERYALRYAYPVYALIIVLTPLIFIVDKLSNAILRLLRVNPQEKVLSISEGELLRLVDAGHQEGVIEQEEREMIHNMFEFGDAVAKDIMIPRVNMVMCDIHADYAEIRELFKEHMYTRLPVYEDSPDNIVGVLNIKDFLFLEKPGHFHMQSLMRDAYYTYEYKKTADLLNEMREKNIAISIVLNEYGTAEGMITMEDLLEEIIGQIRDEYDADEAELIKPLSDDEYLIDGTMKLDDINEALDTDFDSEDYDSISGLIIELLGDRLPEAGEQVLLPDGSTATVEKLDNNRIEEVRLKLAAKEAAADTAE